jgi:hypothetical protein
MRDAGCGVPGTSNFGPRTVVRLPSPDNSTLIIEHSQCVSPVLLFTRIPYLASRIPSFESRFSRQSRPSRLSQGSAVAVEAFVNYAG